GVERRGGEEVGCRSQRRRVQLLVRCRRPAHQLGRRPDDALGRSEGREAVRRHSDRAETAARRSIRADTDHAGELLVHRHARWEDARWHRDGQLHVRDPEEEEPWKAGEGHADSRLRGRDEVVRLRVRGPLMKLRAGGRLVTVLAAATLGAASTSAGAQAHDSACALPAPRTTALSQHGLSVLVRLPWHETRYTVDGEEVRVSVSLAYASDPQAGQRWAEFFASLPHNSELAKLDAYVASLDEVQKICGDEA